MSYTPKYVTEADVEREVQYKISQTTKPNSDDVLDWIEEIEKEIDSRHLGWGDGRAEGTGYLATDAYLDVTLQPSHLQISRTMEALIYRKNLLTSVNVYLGRYYPLIKITSLARRLVGIVDSPEWETLTEGYYPGWVEAAGADFKCLRERGKAGQTHITMIQIFGAKRPEAGLSRIKATFTYGWNIPGKILRRWAVLNLSNKVYKALQQTGEPIRVASYVKGDFSEYVNNQFGDAIAQNEVEINEIERKYFPAYHLDGRMILRL